MKEAGLDMVPGLGSRSQFRFCVSVGLKLAPTGRRICLAWDIEASVSPGHVVRGRRGP